MVVQWLQPILEWTGLGLIPFLIAVLIAVVIITR